MRIDFEWMRMLAFSYWFAKEKPPHRVQRVSIQNFIKQEAEESDSLVAALVIDDSKVDKDDPEYLDLHQLRLSLESDGTFFPWTCSCGVPGCIGRFQGVTVFHHDGKTIWHDLDGNLHFEFDTSMLLVAFRAAVRDGACILAATPELAVTPDQNAEEYRVS